MPNFLNKVPQDNQKQPNKKTIEETKKKEEPKKEEQKKEEIKKEEIDKKEIPEKENNEAQSKTNEKNKEKEIKEDNSVEEKKEEEGQKKVNKSKSSGYKNNTNKEEKETKETKEIKETNESKDSDKSKEKKENKPPEKFEKLKVNLNKTKTLAIKDIKSANKLLDEDFVVLDMNNNDNKENGSKVLFLEPKKYMDYLDGQYKKNIKHPYRETFCEGFFIASFPKQKANVIEINTSFMAQCQHEECSKLPGMKPEIIFRYPLKDTKTLELNNLAATICFPTGIKVCYEENDQPKGIKDYVTSITNQKGERYYMMTYHFYLKMDTEEYNKQYEENPLKYNLRKFADPYTGLSEEELTEEMINEIQNNLDWTAELANRDIVSIPFCICLISKYPYVQEMKSCLKGI